MSEERKRKFLERRKALYECNKELLEIDPNLIIQINLKWWDYFALTTLATVTSYTFLFRNANKTKKLFAFSGIWLIIEWNIARYYSQVYPFILLKNTKEVIEMEKACGKLDDRRV